jgi:DNA-directed RNA polymerase subunit F
VSKEQAQIALAQVLAKANPQEARKLLEPLRSERAAISRNALTLLAELPPAK